MSRLAKPLIVVALILVAVAMASTTVVSNDRVPAVSAELVAATGDTEIRRAPAPLPTNRIKVPYSPDGFTDKADCESYLPGGSNENNTYPQSVVDSAEMKCCATGSNAKEWNSQGPQTGLRCDGDGASFECNGAECDSLSNGKAACGREDTPASSR
ncbi:hypothetical protein ABI59_15155 [Acidobacteria bacterium Mor1]|nr:hypothetical protein ABI59_15155 [Acidobacteria bacterium Mor1]